MLVQRRLGVELPPEAMFVAQVKRFHEYKRQLLACFQVIAHYLKIKNNPDIDVVPRVYLFAGKAAAGYTMAKLHIKLINDVAAVVNSDPVVQGRLAVAFLPNYGVSLAQAIIPAADLSVQISTAGKEASGTSNMKFALNGALTIGTLDGANVEIRDEVGPENFFLFGLRAEEVARLRHEGYDPQTYLRRSPALSRGAGAHRVGVLQLRRAGALRPDPRQHPLARPLHDLRRLRGLRRRRGARRRAVPRPPRVVAAGRCSTSRAPATSPATRPSANTPPTSGPSSRSPSTSSSSANADRPPAQRQPSTDRRRPSPCPFALARGPPWSREG